MNKISPHSLITYIIVIIHTSSQTTIIEKSTNEILFKPLGQLIPELSWATIRIHLNITDMFNETNHLCKASHLMELEYKKLKTKYGSKIPPTKIRSVQAHLLVSLTHDIERQCKENALIIEEICEVFNFRKIKKPKYIPQFKQANNAEGNMSPLRQARQVIIGTVMATIGVITSLISIFTSNELINMSSSKDTENKLVDNSNNIITNLQAHESAIHRNEQAIKQIKIHLENLENELSIERHTRDAYLNLFTLKVFGSSTTQHLQRIHDGLHQLLKNKLSPKLVPLRKVRGII